LRWGVSSSFSFWFFQIEREMIILWWLEIHQFFKFHGLLK
jgi:hypothetical protein